MKKMLKILKSKKAETLLEAVLSILIFSMVILGVASLTGTAQKIALNTKNEMKAYDDRLQVFDGGTVSDVTVITKIEKPTYTYKMVIDGEAVESTFSPEVKISEDNVVDF